jgi:hypothetical protein
MPLPDSVAAIAPVPKHLGHGAAGSIEIALVGWQAAILHHVPDARLMRVKPRQQTGSRRAAARRVVKLAEAKSTGGQLIQVGCMYLTPIATQVGYPHVVAEQNHEAWSLWRRFLRDRSIHRSHQPTEK